MTDKLTVLSEVSMTDYLNLISATFGFVALCHTRVSHIFHEAAFIPKKVKPKEIKSFQSFVLRGPAFSFYKGNPTNIQRKIWAVSICHFFC